MESAKGVGRRHVVVLLYSRTEQPTGAEQEEAEEGVDEELRLPRRASQTLTPAPSSLHARVVSRVLPSLLPWPGWRGCGTLRARGTPRGLRGIHECWCPVWQEWLRRRHPLLPRRVCLALRPQRLLYMGSFHLQACCLRHPRG